MNNDEILDANFPESDFFVGERGLRIRGRIKHAMNIARRDAEDEIKAEICRIALLLPPDTRNTFKAAIAKATKVEGMPIIFKAGERQRA